MHNKKKTSSFLLAIDTSTKMNLHEILFYGMLSFINSWIVCMLYGSAWWWWWWYRVFIFALSKLCTEPFPSDEIKLSNIYSICQPKCTRSTNKIVHLSIHNTVRDDNECFACTLCSLFWFLLLFRAWSWANLHVFCLLCFINF